VLRTKFHQTVVEAAAYANCSVINGLTDQSHPCQALADLYTIRETAGGLAGAKLAWVGDANNVARSLAMACALLGVEFAVASPEGYDFDEPFVAKLHAKAPGAKFLVTRDPVAAVRNASAVYTDVWASMGQEAEQDKRRRDFAEYQVNGKLMAAAGPAARFMHCLPARRGEEVTDEVMDSPYSIIVEQAANRMHVQKGILAWLLGAQS
jgi:ornithine carbamoyltransferase